MRHIRHVVVVGSGLMGSGIACHLANAGFMVTLLDLPATEPGVPRNAVVDAALAKAVISKPSPLYLPEFRFRIQTGNLADDLHTLTEADWIIEAVVEQLEIKRQIFTIVDQYRRPGTIISSNTSGLPIHRLNEGRSEDFRRHFLGTHFFNPPRYLRLLELIPSTETMPAVVDDLERIAERFLGKTTVRCKDTPAFVANRIGVFAMASVFRLTAKLNLPIHVVDKLTGPALARPGTGTFRLADLVGHDTGVRVMEGIRRFCPADEQAMAFEIPGYLRFLLDNNFLGRKTGQGFYKKTADLDGKGKPVFLSLDLNSLTYEKPRAPDLRTLQLTRQIDDPVRRIKALYDQDDAGGQLIREHLLELFSYASHRIPEIADAPYRIDQALKAGFAWSFGPFEYWDIIGLQRGLADGQALGLSFPAWIHRMAESGEEQFYRYARGGTSVYAPASQAYVALPGKPDHVSLRAMRETPPVYANDEAVLHDIGDGVLCLEFTSKANTIGEGILNGLNEGLRLAEEEGWKGLVIGNEATNFSVGANLMLIAMMAFQKEWEKLDQAVRYFQQTSMRCRQACVPVITATQGYVFGGGCELSMHCDAVMAGAESYIGLVEAAVGLIPGGGGTKEFAVRLSDSFDAGDLHIPKLLDRVKTLALAHTSTSAHEAFRMGYLRPGIDEVIRNMADPISAAKRKIIALSEDYRPPVSRQDILVLGRQGLASVYAFANESSLGRYGSDHDINIVRKLAWVICGGDLTGAQQVSEQYLLDLEREAFLSLCGEQKTLERIQYMLEYNKPLKN